MTTDNFTPPQRGRQARRAAAEAAEAQAFDNGHAHFRADPDALLAAVARHAATLYPDTKGNQLAYLEGYQRARAQHDDYLREVTP